MSRHELGRTELQFLVVSFDDIVYRPGLLLQPKFHDSVVHSSRHGVLRAANTCEPVTLNNASDYRHRRGNDFSVRGAKFGEKQSRQSNSKYNFMQNMFFSKKVPVYLCIVQWGLGLAPEAREFSSIFVLKVILQPESYF